MKRITSPISYLAIVFTLFSCHKTDVPYTQSGNWVTRSQLNGPARSEAVAFTIGDFAYLGTGWDGLNKRYGDFWKYDATSDSWADVASMPVGTERSSAVGFAAGGKGFVSTGYDGFIYKADSWEFDVDANTWTQIADFPGGPRYEAVAFGLGDNGYVGTGFDGSNSLKDFYKYSTADSAWTEVGFSGNKRYSATVFTYNNKAYLVTGVNSGTTVNDFWVFDPSAATGTAQWTELRHVTNYSSDTYDDSYTTIVRSNAASFVIGDKGYVTCGENGSLYNFTWEYDFSNDTWVEKTPLEGPGTTGGVGFNIQGRGYFATGRTGAGQAAQSDFLREFQPTIVVNPNDN